MILPRARPKIWDSADAGSARGAAVAAPKSCDLGGTARFHPLRRGFDSFFGFLHEGHYHVPRPWSEITTMLRRRTLPGGGLGRRAFGDVLYSTHLGYDEPEYDANNPILRGGQPVAEAANLTDAFTRKALDFIDRQLNGEMVAPAFR